MSTPDWHGAARLYADERFQADISRLTIVINRESELISQRMTWLMTLNGFLVAGTAALLAARDKFANQPGGRAGLAGVVSTLAVLGVACNLSTLYSNFWAERAIQGADAAFMNISTLSIQQGLYGEQAAGDVLRIALRLAGRDPANAPKATAHGEVVEYCPERFLKPLAKLLHPWFFLPCLFVAGFFVFPAASIVGHRRLVAALWPQVLVIAAFAGIALTSHARELRTAHENRKPPTARGPVG